MYIYSSLTRSYSFIFSSELKQEDKYFQLSSEKEYNLTFGTIYLLILS